MRNLSLLATKTLLPSLDLEESISAVTFDLDEDAIFIATEQITADGDVLVKVLKVEGQDDVLLERGQFVTQFTSSVSSKLKSSCGGPSEIVSFKFLPDTRTLAFIMRSGDIATSSLDEGLPDVDVVGSVEAGLTAASWSPDDSLLILATAGNKLILMTSTFDVVSESTLYPSAFGEDAPINVGWGSKQTQFHGSLGKAAAHAPKPSLIGPSPDDDALPRISWRGDGQYFVVSALSPTSEGTDNSIRHRRLRIYSHTGILQSTSEPTPGLEHAISWRPSGNWIVGTQRYGFEGGGVGREGRHDLVMFERNGLRRHDFAIEKLLWDGQVKKDAESARKWGYRVKEVGWSSDSNILSIWVEKEEGDIVQLWTTGNYHWYLKHEIVAPADKTGHPGRLTSVAWHPEDAFTLTLTTRSRVIQRTCTWETFSSKSKPPADSGSVAVLDGSSILLTPFRSQNVPPPMSAYQLSVSKPPASSYIVPIHVSFSPKKDILITLWEPGYAEIVDLHMRLGPGPGKIMHPDQLWRGYVSPDSRVYRQTVAWAREEDEEDSVRFAALASDVDDLVSIVHLKGSEVHERHDVVLPGRNGRFLYGDHGLSWQAADGEIFDLDVSQRTFLHSAKLSEFCADAECIDARISETAQAQPSLYVGLSKTNKLLVANAQISRTLASNVNSFLVASGFLIFTTTAHVAQFAPLDALNTFLGSGDPNTPVPEWETRRVERGSRIVTAVPSNMSLILQMPRGNLETIYPRPLVMNIVRQDLDRKEYAKAFADCRRHRIDLNIFLQYNKEAFMHDIPLFLDQVDDVDYINLFLTSIGQGSLPSDVIAQACDSIRVELERRDLKKYVNSILTAHVVKRPPDHELALALLLRLRDAEPQLVEEAVKYVIFLVDADKLFDTALGMYDFSLVLMIAQHAQKDPREYLPFLRELRALDKYHQRFRIDDHLKRYEKALRDLSQAGPERFDEAMSYVEKHQLYDAALTIWRDTDEYETVLSVYGDWLFERREFREAAFVFRRAGKPAKAMIAYEKSLDWQELFEIAVEENISEEELTDIAYRVAEDLSSKKRYADASRVLLDYAKNVRQAVIALAEGSHFSEARRIIALHSLPALIEEIVYPAALESRAQISEDLGEMRDQLRKQVQRLRELRIKKVEEPDAFYGVEDMDLHNVDVMTDISMAPTTFTRYTQAASVVSRASTKRSSRSKRKLERKVGSGRKGTVDEEQYLLKSVSKLVGRFNVTQNEATSLLPHLLQFTEEHLREAVLLQQEIVDFAEELKEAVDEIWKRKPVEGEGIESAEDSWVSRMQEYEKQRQIDPLDKIVRPDLAKREWNTKLSTIGNKSI